MPVNTLTTQAGLKIGPIVFETLLKHYFERFKNSQTHAEGSTLLRKEELLYDEAFNVCKAFLEASSYSTVEEVQEFANTKTPSPPWVHVVRLLVPMSSCDDAAKILITALGGEEEARRITGGLKWWQVRGVQGVDAQWITAKEDWKELRRREKERTKGQDANPQPKTDEDQVYEAEMDDMKCILYSHGGGYYFGSIDQERYSMQRHARKINGRVFAINYRLAPQYPFPCALQDLIAAYLFLIRPPEGALHRPVKPSSITIMGDSAGGGLSMALLQVIRDTGLPAPAGAVLISPWCDFTHSFPSIHTNGPTDVIPEFGLSLQKPSPLWPPPTPEVAHDLRLSLRQRLKQTLQPLTRNSGAPLSPGAHTPLASPTAPLSEHGHVEPTSTLGQATVNVGTTAAIPSVDARDQTIRLMSSLNEPIVIDDQLHLYAQNSQIIHPLISPGLSYLGGLPPMLFIASDGEVLRDEVIYAAHRAAYPDKFPIRDDVRALYPPLAGIEAKYTGSPVHLQVYDDCAHVLPVLFSFTTPAKYCFRAIASFGRHVTGTPQRADSSILSPPKPPARSLSVNGAGSSGSSSPGREARNGSKLGNDQGVRKAASFKVLRKPSFLQRRPSRMVSPARSAPTTLPMTEEPVPLLPDDVAGPRFYPKPSPAGSTETGLTRTAGDPVVYSGTVEYPSMNIAMIRERVSTRGVIRALEPEAEIEALNIRHEDIGVLSERVARRYLTGKQKFEKKFPQAQKMVEKQRKKNLQIASKDAERKSSIIKKQIKNIEENGPGHGRAISENGVLTDCEPGAASRGWDWFMDGSEHPPPSSITARQDTVEARRLAKIADQAVLAEEHSFSGNNVWSTVVDFLTVTSSPKAKKSESAETARDS